LFAELEENECEENINFGAELDVDAGGSNCSRVYYACTYCSDLINV